MLDRREADWAQFLGIFIAQLVEREVAAIGQLDRARHGFRAIGKQPPHFRGRFEMPLGVGEAAMPQLGDRGAVTNGRQHVLQRLTGRIVVVDVIRRHEGQAVPPGDVPQVLQTPTIVGSAREFAQQVTPLVERVAIKWQRAVDHVLVAPLGKSHAGQKSVGKLDHVGLRQPAVALFGLAAAAGDQLRQASVSGPIGGEEHDGGRIVGSDLRSDQQLEADLLGRDVRADDAGHAVQIGDRQRPQPQLGGPLHQFVGMRGPFEKTEIRFAVQLGVRKCRLAIRVRAVGRRRQRGTDPFWCRRIGHRSGERQVSACRFLLFFRELFFRELTRLGQNRHKTKQNRRTDTRRSSGQIRIKILHERTTILRLGRGTTTAVGHLQCRPGSSRGGRRGNATSRSRFVPGLRSAQ